MAVAPGQFPREGRLNQLDTGSARAKSAISSDYTTRDSFAGKKFPLVSGG